MGAELDEKLYMSAKVYRDDGVADMVKDAHLLAMSNVFLTDMGRDFLDEYDLYGAF